jgi:hypothetical protein
VWGGGRYPVEHLFSYADEHGLLIWMETMFACSPDPRDPAFLDNVAAEVAQQVRARAARVMWVWARTGGTRAQPTHCRSPPCTHHHTLLPRKPCHAAHAAHATRHRALQAQRLSWHPSVAIWGGNNEIEGSLNWYAESRSNRALFANDYQALFVDTVRRVLRQVQRSDSCVCVSLHVCTGFPCVCACVCVCARACVRACVRARVRVTRYACMCRQPLDVRVCRGGRWPLTPQPVIRQGRNLQPVLRAAGPACPPPFSTST